MVSALDINDENGRADAFRQSALSFVETLESRADETEKLRQLPAATIAELKSTGFSRLCQPRKYGGAELPLDAAVDILSILAGGCASTAWVCAVYTDHSILSSLLPDRATKEIWGKNPEATISAGYHPTGKAERINQSWQLSGKWGWVSGCDFADWYLFGAFASENDADLIHNFFLVPKTDVKIEDNWHVMGMRGTGSKNVMIKEATVPDYRVISLPEANGGAIARGNKENRPLYRLGHVSAVPFVFVSVAIGIAESLLRIMTKQISERHSMGRNLSELQSMQLHFSEVSAEIDCARLLMTRDTSETMEAMRNGRALTLLERGRNRRDMAYAGRLCKSAVDQLHDMAGASGIFDEHAAQRKFRDLQAAVRHIALSWDLAGTNCGEIMLGLEPSSPFV